MQSNTETKNEITDVLEKYVDAYAEKNLDSLMNIVSKDENTIFVGTGTMNGPMDLKK